MNKILAVALSIVACHCFGQGTLQRINGTELFLTIEGKGKPVIVIHGGPGLNQAYFKPHLEPLSKDFRIIYYDQRACGRSAIPAADSISIQFMVEDIEALRKSLGLKKVNLLAHSWGAFLAVQYGLRYPRRVESMVLSNPSALSREYDAEIGRIMKARTTREDSVRRSALMRSGPMDLKKYEDFFLLSFKPSAYDPQNLNRLNLGLPANFAEANKSLFGALMKDPAMVDNLYGSLGKLDFPVMVIHGEADIIPPASLSRLLENLPQSRLVTFTKSGHFPFIEENEKYTEVVRGFFKDPASGLQKNR